MEFVLAILKKNSLSIIIGSIMIIISGIAGVLLFGYFLPASVEAKENGTAIGDGLGTTVGMAIGSFDGVTNGIGEGAKDGKAAGLSAKDTEVSVQENMARIGKLEVLQASVSIVNKHKVGDDLIQLHVMYADAVFTVDLTQARIEENAAEMRITLPPPEMSLNIDETKTEKIAEYEELFFNGSAEDGFDAALNSNAVLGEEAANHISNYPALMEQARNAAIRNIEMLAGQVSMDKKTITVVFDDESGVA
ncbi:MAG: DUF4230 domain-containing protein [Oscillospiraceae bacterium]|nr:DUF4230 domain-containing protein [Oscillospiraceae bacterium]